MLTLGACVNNEQMSTLIFAVRTLVLQCGHQCRQTHKIIVDNTKTPAKPIILFGLAGGVIKTTGLKYWFCGAGVM